MIINIPRDSIYLLPYFRVFLKNQKAMVTNFNEYIFPLNNHFSIFLEYVSMSDSKKDGQAKENLLKFIFP